MEIRKRHFGKNYIEPIPPDSYLKLAFEALTDKTLIILMVAAAISVCLSLYSIWYNAPERKHHGIFHNTYIEITA